MHSLEVGKSFDRVFIANECLDSKNLEKAYTCQLGLFVVYAKEVWLWGDMVFWDSSFHFFSAILDFSERHSNGSF